MKQHSGLFSSVTQLKCFFVGGWLLNWSSRTAADVNADISVLLLHFCRILHLAIIHEEEFIAHQLIQLFPKNVLDIQNNLYQVSLHASASLQQLLLEFLDPQWLPLSWYLVCGNGAVIFVPLCFQRNVVPLYLQIVRDVTVGGSSGSSSGALSGKSPPVEIESQGVRPCMDVGGGILSLVQCVRPFLFFVQKPEWNWAKSHLLKVKKNLNIRLSTSLVSQMGLHFVS